MSISGALFQWPIGSLSDKYDRRVIIIGSSIAASIFAIGAIIASGAGASLPNLFMETTVSFNYFSTTMDKTKLFLFIILLTGTTLPLFSLNLALVNDQIPKEKFVAAGGGLNIIFGIGAISGPIICSLFMNWFEINGLFIFLIIAHIIIGIFGIYRMNVRAVAENPDSTFTSVPATITPAGLELDPDTPETLDNNQAEQ